MYFCTLHKTRITILKINQILLTKSINFMKKIMFLLFTLLLSVTMFAQQLQNAKLLQAEVTDPAPSRSSLLLTPSAIAPTNLTGYATGNQGVLNWAGGVYEAGYDNGISSTSGAAISGAGTHLLGVKIPQSVIANYVGWEFINFGFSTGANGSAITGFYYFYGETGSTGASGITSTNNAWNSWNWTTPIPITAEFATGDLYLVVVATGAVASRTFLRYDTQGAGQAGITCIRSTDGGVTWIDAAANQTFCLYSTMRNPAGATYKVYGDGTLVADNITTNTYTIPALPTPAKSYTVTENHTGLLESPHSNAVVLGPSELVTPTGLTGVWSGAPEFIADLSWNYPTSASIGGFYIYSNGVKVATIGATDRTYTQNIIATGNYIYTVSAFATDLSNESAPSNSWSVNADLPEDPCLPPFNLQAAEPIVASVDLTWEDPRDATFEKYAISSSEASIGGFTNASYTFLKGIGFTPEQMADWGSFGFSLKAVKVPAAATIAQNNGNRVKLYKGVNDAGYPATQVLDQVVSTGFTAGWNTITLTTPYLVDVTQNFYVVFTGYNTSTTAFHYLYEANSPYVNKLTNLFNMASGSSTTVAPTNTLWDSQARAGSMAIIAVFGYTDLSKSGTIEASFENGKWNIISINEDAEPVMEQSISNPEENIKLTPSPLVSFALPKTLDPRNEGFFVYRNNTKLNATLTPNYVYTDIPTQNGVYEYKVSANYTDVCGEVFSESVFVEFGDIFVKNLTASVIGRVITLNWDACAAGQFLRYNVYAKGVLVGTITNVAETTFEYLGESGTYDFQVSATYNFDTGIYETKRANVSIYLVKYGVVDNIRVEPLSGNTLQGLLKWDVPTDGNIDLYTKSTNDAYKSGVGFGATTGSLRVGHLYTPENLGNISYNRIKTISVYISGSDVTAQGTAEVYLATSTAVAGIVSGSRVAFTPVLDAWNTIEMPSTLTINASNNLYVGYILTNWNGYPAAYDNTTLAGATNGLIATSATAALSAGTYGCWMIKMELYTKTGEPRTDVEGYQVVKNGDFSTLISTTDTEYTITDNVTSEYWVSAVYANGGSDWKKATANFYPVSLTVGDNGTASMSDDTQAIPSNTYVLVNSTLNVSTTPNTGYHLKDIKVDGVVKLEGENPVTETLTQDFTSGAPQTSVAVEFAPNNYTLTFSTTVSTVTPTEKPVTYNEPIGELPIPTPISNWTFMGWYIGTTEITAATVWDFTTNQIATAKWNPTYTLTFNPGVNGVVTPTSKIVTYELPIGVLPTPTMIGYNFTGWFIDGTQITEETVWMFSANRTATAQWTAKTYTLTLDASTGTVLGLPSTTMTVTYNLPINSLPNAVQPNCTFLGWFIGTTQIYNTDIWTIDENTTAIAKFNYPIVASATGQGTIAPTGTIIYSLHDNATYVCTPNPGYHVIVTVDGTVVFPGNKEITEPYEHVFSDIDKYHTIQATFVQNCYAMNPGNIADGTTITMTPTNCVNHGQEVTFKFNKPCYDIVNVKIGGVSQGAITSYTMTATEPLPVIEIETVLQQYSVTATPLDDPTGAITPSGTTTYDCGQTVTYTIAPAMGYRPSALYIDDVLYPIPTTFSWTFANISANHTIHVEFEEYPQFLIVFGPNPDQNAGGYLYSTRFPNAINYIAADSADTYTFNIVPDVGHVIDKVYVDNVINNQAALTGTYTFANVKAPHEIFVTFKPIMLTITATAGANGSINPTGAVQVAYGSNQIFQIIPAVGAYITDVYVDGNSVGAVDVYTFENVMTHRTIAATFAKNTYVITTEVGANGSITPANPIVEHGAAQTLTFIPEIGYKVNEVFVDGVENQAAALAGSFTFQRVTEPHTVYVNFTKIQFTVTATHTNGGELIPSGVSYVDYGDHSETYVFHAWEGHHVAKVYVDGANNFTAVENMMYRFMDVVANHTLHVIYAPDNLTIVATTSEGGDISPAGNVIVTYGSEKLFQFAPHAGYELTRVLIDGIEDLASVADGFYKFTNITSEHAIFAQFEKSTHDVIYQPVPGALVSPVNGFSSPVAHGGSYKFTIELEEGYSKSNILVRVNDIALYPAGEVYAINNIYADQYITIENVIPNTYEVIARAYIGGTITPAGIFVVTHGEEKTFTITPELGFIISDVVVNGESIGDVNTYTFFDIRGNNTISAYFKVPQNIDLNDEATITVFSYQNVVTIVNNNLIAIKQVEIIDMYGRLVWSGKALNERTEIVLDVATGIYGVRVTTESTTTTTKVSIIK